MKLLFNVIFSEILYNSSMESVNSKGSQIILFRNYVSTFIYSYILLNNGTPFYDYPTNNVRSSQWNDDIYVNVPINKMEKSIFMAIMLEYFFLLDSLVMKVYNGVTSKIQC